MLENLTDAWRGIVDVQFRISGRETRPQMLQVAAPNEVVLLMSFEIRIGDVRGVLNICFPAASIEAVSGSFTRSWQRTQREMTPTEQAALDENVGRVEVTLSAGIEAAIGAGDFLRLQVGDIVGLEHPASASRSRSASTARPSSSGRRWRRRPARTSASRDPFARPGPTPPEAHHVPTRPRARPGPLHPVRRRDAVRRHPECRGPAVRRRGRARLAGAVRAVRPDRRHVVPRRQQRRRRQPRVARADEGDGVARRDRRGAQGADGAGAVGHRPRGALHRDGGQRRQAGDGAGRAGRRRRQLRLPPRRDHHALLRLQLRRRFGRAGPSAGGIGAGRRRRRRAGRRSGRPTTSS